MRNTLLALTVIALLSTAHGQDIPRSSFGGVDIPILWQRGKYIDKTLDTQREMKLYDVLDKCVNTKTDNSHIESLYMRIESLQDELIAERAYSRRLADQLISKGKK